jgi:hypothetical protein
MPSVITVAAVPEGAEVTMTGLQNEARHRQEHRVLANAAGAQGRLAEEPRGPPRTPGAARPRRTDARTPRRPSRQSNRFEGCSRGVREVFESTQSL